MTTRVSRPIITTRKVSEGPKDWASLAKDGASTVSRMSPIVPATKDPTAQSTRAGPARPCWASGYPSKVLATVEDSPGVFMRTEVMVPPNMAP